MIDDPLLPPVGVLRMDDRTTRWRVWASKAQRVDLVLDPEGQARTVSMTAEPGGYFVCETEAVADGQRYAYSLDGGPPLPDPLSRWQPDGVNRPSAVFDPTRFPWNESNWRGLDDPRDLIFYELHVGTFTSEGTFDAVIPRLDSLKELGITAIELMPVGQFSGQRGWGYDGVHPFAPQNSLGGPQGLQRLVEASHRAGLAIYLDVVYNHLGPEGNVFPAYGHYFNDRYRTDWGPAINYDNASCDQVRAMVLENVRMWIRDYRFDGLRLDAADQIYDRSASPLLAEVAEP
ncbi:MAG TPA: alpha-amylase family glycosyl hydrolase, partial [Isosphaeraceae bacterium]|nr:alpha-amylase family glycosyl hydrolase [Isosphaeraceae bacterium]